MDIFGEDSCVEPVDLTDVRSFLSMQATDQSEDHLLTLLISSSRAIIEQYLPFWVAERSVDMRGFAHGSDRRVRIKGPVMAVSDVLVKTGTDQDTDEGWVDISEGCITYSDQYDTMVILPEGTVGPLQIDIVTGAYCPKAVQQAILIMVRNQYVDRISDPFTPEVGRIIAPFVEVKT